jgi:hypothetical protein
MKIDKDKLFDMVDEYPDGTAVYFLQETERSEDGGYVPCIAKKGEKGFYRTDWDWGTDKEAAQGYCSRKNSVMLDCSADDAETIAFWIQLSTMGE